MVVAKDTTSALMFGCNLLGNTDVRNVLSSLSGETGKAFLEEEGVVEAAEKAWDDNRGFTQALPFFQISITKYAIKSVILVGPSTNRKEIAKIA